MTRLTIVMGIAAVVALLVAPWLKRLQRSPESPGSRRAGGAAALPGDSAARRVLTAREWALFDRLVDALPECRILAQVGLTRVVDCEGGAGNRALWNPICQKSIDFLVCGRGGEVIAAVELDDGSHGTQRTRARDSVKDDVCRLAGVRLIRWSDVPAGGRIRLELGLPSAEGQRDG